MARRGQDPGRLVGRVYAANTAGAIIGALGFSILLIPGIGTQHSQRLLIGLSTAAALFAPAPLRWPFRTDVSGSRDAKERPLGIRGAVSLLASMGVVALLVWSLPAVPWGAVAWGHQLPTKMLPGDLLYLGEGINASIAVTETRGRRSFHVSGKVEASGEPQDMRLQRMLGHIPALLHRRPRSVLVVGCGTGITSGTFVLHPSVERIVICEIEPLIPPAVTQYFQRENYDVLHDRRTKVVYDDARHYILTTRDRFDVITSDPIHPWVKGSASLYSKEYFELCRRRLNPGGVITQWVPLYQSTMEAVRSQIATFFEVFPSGIIWCNETASGENNDLVLFGQTEPARIDVDGLQQRLNRADHSLVAESLREVGFWSAVRLLKTYTGRAADLQPWLQDAQINRDRNLRLQYLAGMGLDLQDAALIYEEMVRYRYFPDDLFVASQERKEALRRP